MQFGSFRLRVGFHRLGIGGLEGDMNEAASGVVPVSFIIFFDWLIS
jgi:hypothetical protein